MKYLRLFAMLLLFAGMTACSDEPETPGAEEEEVNPPADENHDAETPDGAEPDKTGPVAGFYVLNEGNMGANKSTIDYFEYAKSRYIRNIYPERNPSVVMELGDAGNDIAVYKDRLYAVINGSHKVEVMRADSAIRIGQMEVSSPRSIVFDGNSAYVTSFVGGDGNFGSVVRFDLATLKSTGSLSVGYCPEEMVIADGYIYVANSQNYGIGAFDDKITVISTADFKVAGEIKVGCNLRHLRADAQGNLWVVSQGNYVDIAANLYKLPKEGVNKFGAPKAFDIPCTNIALAGEKLYYYTTTYGADWSASYTYGTINTVTGAEEGSFIKDDAVKNDIQTPYCIAIQPANGDIFITDARNYTSSGKLYCLDKDGKLRWSVKTGDIPGHIAFVMR